MTSLDVAVVGSVDELASNPEVFDAIHENTDVPFRFVVVAFGGRERDLDVLRAHLQGLGRDWVLVFDEHVHSSEWGKAVAKALPLLQGQLVAVVRPQIRITDPEWFGKMQVVFLKDPVAMVALTEEGLPGNTMPPNRIQHGFKTSCGLLMLRKQPFQAATFVITDSSPNAFSSLAKQVGGTSWVIPSVRFHVQSHTVSQQTASGSDS